MRVSLNEDMETTANWTTHLLYNKFLTIQKNFLGKLLSQYVRSLPWRERKVLSVVIFIENLQG